MTPEFKAPTGAMGVHDRVPRGSTLACQREFFVDRPKVDGHAAIFTDKRHGLSRTSISPFSSVCLSTPHRPLEQPRIDHSNDPTSTTRTTPHRPLERPHIDHHILWEFKNSPRAKRDTPSRPSSSRSRRTWSPPCACPASRASWCSSTPRPRCSTSTAAPRRPRQGWAAGTRPATPSPATTRSSTAAHVQRFSRGRLTRSLLLRPPFAHDAVTALPDGEACTDRVRLRHASPHPLARRLGGHRPHGSHRKGSRDRQTAWMRDHAISSTTSPTACCAPRRARR